MAYIENNWGWRKGGLIHSWKAPQIPPDFGLVFFPMQNTTLSHKGSEELNKKYSTGCKPPQLILISGP